MLPGGQTHIHILSICRIVDDFRGCFPGYSPVEFVLYCGEKIFCNGSIFIIIGGQSVYIRNFLVKSPFTGPDFPYTFKKFIKIVFAKNGAALLKA